MNHLDPGASSGQIEIDGKRSREGIRFKKPYLKHPTGRDRSDDMGVRVWFSFDCEKCGAKLEIDSTMSGQPVECPQCEHQVTVPQASIVPGVIIGGFKIKKQLGCGAMGAVFLAYQISMDRNVALKILPPDFYKDQDAVEMFQQEVRLQARLEHPNIVTAHESGEDDGIYYLAMAYLPESLEARLKREGILPEEEALEIIHKLAGALAYAWERHRLLHRDIKPANIMLDQDESPRLTDLGLSKSLVSTDKHAKDDWVVGTPNYMSPEQAAGEQDLDFRTDIYSLGATLYHLVTGAVPFEGADSEEIFKKQTTEPLTDPRDLNKKVSDECVELLALMLALDRNQRHASWDALIGDLQRVMAKEHPSKQPLGEGESVMLRVQGLEHRKGILRKSQIRRQRKGGMGPGGRSRKAPLVVAGLVSLAILAAGSWLVMQDIPWPDIPWPGREPALPAEIEEIADAHIEEAIEEDRMLELQHRFDEAQQYAETYPIDYAGAIQRFEEIREKGSGTEFETRATRELERIGAARQEAAQGIWKELGARAEELFEEGKTAEATALLLDYDGTLAEETSAQRTARAADMARRVEEAERIRQQEIEATRARFDGLAKAAAEDLIGMNFEQAAMRIQVDPSEEEWRPVASELRALAEQVEQVCAMPRLILDSFRSDRGREVTVQLHSGPQVLTIRAVGRDGSIQARRHFEGVAGFVAQNFRIEDLAIQEWINRLGPDPAPDRDIMRGLLLHRMRNPAAATRFFQRAEGVLADALVQRVGQELIGEREREAEEAFARLLRVAGLPPGTEVTEDVIRQVRRTAYPAASVVPIRTAAGQFREEYGDTEQAIRMARMLGALERVDTVPREVEEEVLERAIRRLRADNPRVDELSFSYVTTDDGIEMDLSENPELVTIAALERLPLRKLNLSKTGVRDVRPLRMLTLRELNLAGSAVDDIQMLQGMPLEVLNLTGCAVRNIRPLEGMPLRHLEIGSTGVFDLSPLKGMPLEYLWIMNTRVMDISPLRGMPLQLLDIHHTSITDLSPLRDMPLRHLYIWDTHVSDLSPLTGMSLTRIGASRTRQLNDLTPLAGMTTLEQFDWTRWDVIRVMHSIHDNINEQNFDVAEEQALTLAATLDGVPAFAEAVRLLRKLGEERIPAIQEAVAAPDKIRDTAKVFMCNRYALGPGCADFDTALAFSRSVGGTLASVTSQEERDWIVENFALYGIPVRLGGSEGKEGEWEWVGGEPWTYQAWMPGQPDGGADQNSLVMHWDGLWDDTGCFMFHPYLIQWKDDGAAKME